MQCNVVSRLFLQFISVISTSFLFVTFLVTLHSLSLAHSLSLKAFKRPLSVWSLQSYFHAISVCSWYVANLMKQRYNFIFKIGENRDLWNGKYLKNLLMVTMTKCLQFIFKQKWTYFKKVSFQLSVQTTKHIWLISFTFLFKHNCW